MLTIRLTRKGKKNQPFFRVVLIDKRRSSKGGRAVEDLGFKNPLTKKISLNKDRILYWIKNGAQPSATVHNLLISEKIIDDKKIKITNISKKKQEEMAKAKADAAASQSEASLAPEGAGSQPAPAETPKEEQKPETSASENSGETKPAE